VFKTGFFFKPAIIFGSKESMEEYRTFEAGLPVGRCMLKPVDTRVESAWVQLLKLIYDKLLSTDAFNSHLRRCIPGDAALPETFRELHTQYGALRQSGAKHKATRAVFGKVLGR